jgi:hypothetical protein
MAARDLPLAAALEEYLAAVAVEAVVDIHNHSGREPIFILKMP